MASGSIENPVKIWAMGTGAAWLCERMLVGQGNWVYAMATWWDKVIIGSDDENIQVWDMGTGVHDATLTGHDGGVEGLVVHGDRLLSASGDGTIREWAVGTWAALRTVEVFGSEVGETKPGISPRRLLTRRERNIPKKRG